MTYLVSLKYNFLLIVNIGIYKIEKCIGRGSTGRVSKYYFN